MKVWKYALLVFLGGCSYGVVSTFVKLAYGEGFSVGDVTGSQYVLGAIMLWIFAMFVPRNRLRGKQWITLLISGFPMGLTGIFYNRSLEYIDASFAIILLLQFTWISIVLQFIIDKQTPSRKSVVATVIILLGSLLASGFLKSDITFSYAGIGWGLLAALAFATFIFISGRTGIPVHPILKSAIMTTGAATTCMYHTATRLSNKRRPFKWITHLWSVFWFFGSLVPPVLFNIGMPKVGSSLGTILSASELPTAVLMSTLILHEAVTFSQWIGVIMILAGIAFPNIQRRSDSLLMRE